MSPIITGGLFAALGPQIEQLPSMHQIIHEGTMSDFGMLSQARRDCAQTNVFVCEGPTGFLHQMK
jgi:hypothetical protein